MTIDKGSPKSFSSLVMNYDFKLINLYWLLLIVKTASYTYRVYVAVKYLGLSAFWTRHGALRHQCSAMTTGFFYCDTGFSALNSNWGKRTRKRPNWLDNCTWLGISSERLPCCGKGTCHGSQSTVGSATTEIRTHRELGLHTFILGTLLYLLAVQILMLNRTRRDVKRLTRVRTLLLSYNSN